MELDQLVAPLDALVWTAGAAMVVVGPLLFMTVQVARALLRFRRIRAEQADEARWRWQAGAMRNGRDHMWS